MDKIDLDKAYQELYKAIEQQKQEKYDELIKFINKLCLHELRRSQLIGKIDKLVDAMGGIDE